MTLGPVMGTFVRVAHISSHTRQTLAPHLPAIVQELFSYGVGYLGDGMIRSVDPVDIAGAVSRLAAPIHAAHSFPVLTSAFGDVVTVWRSRLYLLDSKYGRYVGLGRAARLGDVIAELLDPGARDFLLERMPWAQAVALHGMPSPRECFAFVPPLTVRPRASSDASALVRCSLRAHLEFLADFHGPALGRW